MVAFNSAIPYVQSPHFSSRNGRGVEGLVIHYTAGGKGSGTVRWFADPASRVSAHFVLSRSGQITQMVDLSMKAWHAGTSEMQLPSGEMESNANKFTIGFELANYGWLQKSADSFYYELGGKMRQARLHPDYPPVEAELIYDNGQTVRGWWEPYSDAQLDSLDWVIKKLAEDSRYKRAVSNIMGHDSIAMPFAARKRDPGPLFPWQRFGGWDRQRVVRS